MLTGYRDEFVLIKLRGLCYLELGVSFMAVAIIDGVQIIEVSCRHFVSIFYSLHVSPVNIHFIRRFVSIFFNFITVRVLLIPTHFVV